MVSVCIPFAGLLNLNMFLFAGAAQWHVWDALLPTDISPRFSWAETSLFQGCVATSRALRVTCREWLDHGLAAGVNMDELKYWHDVLASIWRNLHDIEERWSALQLGLLDSCVQDSDADSESD